MLIDLFLKFLLGKGENLSFQNDFPINLKMIIPFQALDVDPILYMLVFGESMLNDAVSIVLTT